jgi:hypothetical protein
MGIFRKSYNCPSCGSPSIYKSRRKGLLEHVIYKAIFISPYRCGSCDERHYRFRLSSPHVHKQHQHSA